jgi:hypothetical protein
MSDQVTAPIAIELQFQQMTEADYAKIFNPMKAGLQDALTSAMEKFGPSGMMALEKGLNHLAEDAKGVTAFMTGANQAFLKTRDDIIRGSKEELYEMQAQIAVAQRIGDSFSEQLNTVRSIRDSLYAQTQSAETYAKLTSAAKKDIADQLLLVESIEKSLLETNSATEEFGSLLSQIGLGNVGTFVRDLTSAPAFVKMLTNSVFGYLEQQSRWTRQNNALYGSLRQINQQVIMASRDATLLNEEAQQAAVSLIGMSVAKDSLRELTGAVGDVTREVGLSSDVAAKYAKKMQVMGESTTRVSEEFKFLKQSTAQWGLTGDDANAVMGTISKTAMTMKASLGDAGFKEYKDNLIKISGIAKQSGGDVTDVTEIMSDLGKEPAKYAVLLKGIDWLHTADTTKLFQQMSKNIGGNFDLIMSMPAGVRDKMSEQMLHMSWETAQILNKMSESGSSDLSKIIPPNLQDDFRRLTDPMYGFKMALQDIGQVLQFILTPVILLINVLGIAAGWFTLLPESIKITVGSLILLGMALAVTTSGFSQFISKMAGSLTSMFSFGVAAETTTAEIATSLGTVGSAFKAFGAAMEPIAVPMLAIAASFALIGAGVWLLSQSVDSLPKLIGTFAALGVGLLGFAGTALIASFLLEASVAPMLLAGVAFALIAGSVWILSEAFGVFAKSLKILDGVNLIQIGTQMVLGGTILLGGMVVMAAAAAVGSAMAPFAIIAGIGILSLVYPLSMLAKVVSSGGLGNMAGFSHNLTAGLIAMTGALLIGAVLLPIILEASISFLALGISLRVLEGALDMDVSRAMLFGVSLSVVMQSLMPALMIASVMLPFALASGITFIALGIAFRIFTGSLDIQDNGRAMLFAVSLNAVMLALVIPLSVAARMLPLALLASITFVALGLAFRVFTGALDFNNSRALLFATTLNAVMLALMIPLIIAAVMLPSALLATVTFVALGLAFRVFTGALQMEVGRALAFAIALKGIMLVLMLPLAIAAAMLPEALLAGITFLALGLTLDIFTDALHMNVGAALAFATGLAGVMLAMVIPLAIAAAMLPEALLAGITFVALGLTLDLFTNALHMRVGAALAFASGLAGVMIAMIIPLAIAAAMLPEALLAGITFVALGLTLDLFTNALHMNVGSALAFAAGLTGVMIAMIIPLAIAAVMLPTVLAASISFAALGLSLRLFESVLQINVGAALAFAAGLAGVMIALIIPLAIAAGMLPEAILASVTFAALGLSLRIFEGALKMDVPAALAFSWGLIKVMGALVIPLMIATAMLPEALLASVTFLALGISLRLFEGALKMNVPAALAFSQNLATVMLNLAVPLILAGELMPLAILAAVTFLALGLSLRLFSGALSADISNGIPYATNLSATMVAMSDGLIVAGLLLPYAILATVTFLALGLALRVFSGAIDRDISAGPKFGADLTATTLSLSVGLIAAAALLAPALVSIVAFAVLSAALLVIAGAMVLLAPVATSMPALAASFKIGLDSLAEAFGTIANIDPMAIVGAGVVLATALVLIAGLLAIGVAGAIALAIIPATVAFSLSMMLISAGLKSIGDTAPMAAGLPAFGVELLAGVAGLLVAMALGIPLLALAALSIVSFSLTAVALDILLGAFAANAAGISTLPGISGVFGDAMLSISAGMEHAANSPYVRFIAAATLISLGLRILLGTLSHVAGGIRTLPILGKNFEVAMHGIVNGMVQLKNVGGAIVAGAVALGIVAGALIVSLALLDVAMFIGSLMGKPAEATAFALETLAASLTALLPVQALALMMPSIGGDLVLGIGAIGVAMTAAIALIPLSLLAYVGFAAFGFAMDELSSVLTANQTGLAALGQLASFPNAMYALNQGMSYISLVNAALFAGAVYVFSTKLNELLAVIGSNAAGVGALMPFAQSFDHAMYTLAQGIGWIAGVSGPLGGKASDAGKALGEIAPSLNYFLQIMTANVSGIGALNVFAGGFNNAMWTIANSLGNVQNAKKTSDVLWTFAAGFQVSMTAMLVAVMLGAEVGKYTDAFASGIAKLGPGLTSLRDVAKPMPGLDDFAVSLAVGMFLLLFAVAIGAAMAPMVPAFNQSAVLISDGVSALLDMITPSSGFVQFAASFTAGLIELLPGVMLGSLLLPFTVPFLASTALLSLGIDTLLDVVRPISGFVVFAALLTAGLVVLTPGIILGAALLPESIMFGIAMASVGLGVAALLSSIRPINGFVAFAATLSAGVATLIPGIIAGAAVGWAAVMFGPAMASVALGASALANSIAPVGNLIAFAATISAGVVALTPGIIAGAAMIGFAVPFAISMVMIGLGAAALASSVRPIDGFAAFAVELSAGLIALIPGIVAGAVISPMVGLFAASMVLIGVAARAIGDNIKPIDGFAEFGVELGVGAVALLPGVVAGAMILPFVGAFAQAMIGVGEGAKAIVGSIRPIDGFAAFAVELGAGAVPLLVGVIAGAMILPFSGAFAQAMIGVSAGSEALASGLQPIDGFAEFGVELSAGVVGLLPGVIAGSLLLPFIPAFIVSMMYVGQGINALLDSVKPVAGLVSFAASVAASILLLTPAVAVGALMAPLAPLFTFAMEIASVGIRALLNVVRPIGGLDRFGIQLTSGLMKLKDAMVVGAEMLPIALVSSLSMYVMGLGLGELLSVFSANSTGIAGLPTLTQFFASAMNSLAAGAAILNNSNYGQFLVASTSVGYGLGYLLQAITANIQAFSQLGSLAALAPAMQKLSDGMVILIAAPYLQFLLAAYSTGRGLSDLLGSMSANVAAIGSLPGLSAFSSAMQQLRYGMEWLVGAPYIKFVSAARESGTGLMWILAALSGNAGAVNSLPVLASSFRGAAASIMAGIQAVTSGKVDGFQAAAESVAMGLVWLLVGMEKGSAGIALLPTFSANFAMAVDAIGRAMVLSTSAGSLKQFAIGTIDGLSVLGDGLKNNAGALDLVPWVTETLRDLEDVTSGFAGGQNMINMAVAVDTTLSTLSAGLDDYATYVEASAARVTGALDSITAITSDFNNGGIAQVVQNDAVIQVRPIEQDNDDKHEDMMDKMDEMISAITTLAEAVTSSPNSSGDISAIRRLLETTMPDLVEQSAIGGFGGRSTNWGSR